MFPGSLGHTKDACDKVHYLCYTAAPQRDILQGLGCLLIDVTINLKDMAPI
jgi:hypothetical protein